VGDPSPSPAPATSAAPGAWRVLYDADCGFCVWAVSVLLAWDRHRRLRPGAIQSREGQELLAEIEPGERLSSWHLISPAGEISSGGSAFAPLLGLLPAGAPGAAAASAAPALGERTYGWVAAHRSALSTLVPAWAKRRARARVNVAEAEPRPGRHQ
jgi:predicted DCC family thiol-disulfide oxidoreductase YuxK